MKNKLDNLLERFEKQGNKIVYNGVEYIKLERGQDIEEVSGKSEQDYNFYIFAMMDGGGYIVRVEKKS